MLEDIRNAKRYQTTYPNEDGHKQLDEAYERLWKANHNQQFHDVQIRLFQLVLAAFEGLTLTRLTSALKIDPENPKRYDHDLKSKYVENLYNNFLTTGLNGTIVFVHKSAKDFLVERLLTTSGDHCFSEAQNHLVMVQVALQALEDVCHPVWVEAGLDLPTCQKHFLGATFVKHLFSAQDYLSEGTLTRLRHLPSSANKLDEQKLYDLLKPLEGHGSFAHYITNYWARHLAHLGSDAGKLRSVLGAVTTFVTAETSALLVVIITRIVAGVACANGRISLLDSLSGAGAWAWRRGPDMVGLRNDRAVLLAPHLSLAVEGFLSSGLSSPTKEQLNDTPQSTATEGVEAFSPYQYDGSPVLNWNGETVLHVAIRHCEMEAIEFFLNFEKCRIKSGKSPLLLWTYDCNGQIPIQAVAMNRLFEVYHQMWAFDMFLDSEFDANLTDFGLAKSFGQKSAQVDQESKQLSMISRDGSTIWDMEARGVSLDAIRIMLKYEAAWANMPFPPPIQALFESKFSSRVGPRDGNTAFEIETLGFPKVDPRNGATAFERIVKRLGSISSNVRNAEEFIFWFLNHYAVYGSAHLESVLESHLLLMENMPQLRNKNLKELDEVPRMDGLVVKFSGDEFDLAALEYMIMEADCLLKYRATLWERLRNLPRRPTPTRDI